LRITGVRTVLYEYPTPRPIGDVQLPDGATRLAEVAVFLDTDEEPVGVAIASPAAQPVVHRLAEELIGEDPRAVRGLHERMRRLVFKAGPGAATGTAVAALDCALWDLRAKQHGVPLWRELGAATNRVAAYASGLDMPLSNDELRSYYGAMATQCGIVAGKLKVGRDPELDLERLAIMRDALETSGEQPRPSLMIDANEFWSPKQAIRRIREIEREFDLVWAEEPVRRDDHRGLARVSRGVRTSVATGENLTDPRQFVPLLVHEAVDVVQVAVQGTGITAALQIFEMADAFGLPVALVNSPGRFAAHVGTVLPNHLMMEVIDPPPDAVYATDDRVMDGCIVLGDQPGLGIAFDEDRLARFMVDAPSADSLGMRYRRAEDSGIAETGAHVRPGVNEVSEVTALDTGPSGARPGRPR
jgi:L-alanine-DL-glutamate epimerase-like enolase superfamily enzyme